MSQRWNHGTEAHRDAKVDVLKVLSTQWNEMNSQFRNDHSLMLCKFPDAVQSIIEMI